MAEPKQAVRVYYQITEDSRDKAQGRFIRFQTFEDTDRGRSAARSARFLSTNRVLPLGEFERSRERIVQEIKRAHGLDRKEKELQADFWTKEAEALARARKHREAIDLVKKALALVPSHQAARHGLTQFERMIKEATPSTEQFQLLAQIRSVSYPTKVDGKLVNRSGYVLTDYVFCPKRHAHPGYQPWGRPYTKSDIVRDHPKIVEALVREKNLVVSRLNRGTAKALFWTKGAASGWQLEDCCAYRDLKDTRGLLVKDKVPFQV
jgi:hypothetical protein